MIFGRDSMPRQYSLFQYPSCNDLHWSWYITSSIGFAGVLYSVLPSYQWTHICVTYNNPNCTIYINGEKVKEVTGVTKYTDFNYQTEVIHNSAYHYLMDYRVYNHCLSFNEVKNIYKGLFLHYPLNNLINENLVPNLAQYTKSNPYTIDTPKVDGWVWMTGTTFICEANTKYTVQVKSDGTCTSVHSGSGHLPENKDFSVWLYTCNEDTTKNAYNGGYDTADNLKNNTHNYRFENGKHIWTYTTSSNAKYMSFRLNAYSNGTDNVIVNFWDMKIEKGDTATKYTPNVNDELYTQMGYDDKTVYDVSGYCNNGTIVNSPTFSSDSPFYSGAYYFDGAEVRQVTTPNMLLENFTQGTISMWINRYSTDSNWRTYLYFANSFNWTGNGLDAIIFATTGGSNISMDCCSNVYSFSIDLNKWYMCTLTWDLETHTVKYYVNGELKKTNTNDRINTTYMSKHNYHLIGNHNGYASADYSLSDLRIYYTALTDEDVKELYQTRFKIDVNGNFLTTGELVEE